MNLVDLCMCISCFSLMYSVLTKVLKIGSALISDTHFVEDYFQLPKVKVICA